jgi:peptidoglycan/LPS O-acetylase OafA/YrhL
MGALRVILAAAVIIAHSGTVFGLRLTGGEVAVQVFYMVSGFYMTLILDTKYRGKGSYPLFISNRFLRIYPVFWVVLLLTLLMFCATYRFTASWGGLASFHALAGAMSPGTLAFFILSNLLIFGQDLVFFLGLDSAGGGLFFTSRFADTHPRCYEFLVVPQAWTLGIELLFYLVAPFIVRRRAVVVVCLIAASLSLRLALHSGLGYNHDPWTYRFFPSELALFLAGTLAYKLYRHLSSSRQSCFSVRIQGAVVTAYFSLLLAFQFLPLTKTPFYLLTGIALPFIFQFTKSLKLDAKIGELSYPMYISHVLVISAVTPLIERFGLQQQSGPISVAATVLFSAALVRFVVDPIEVFRQSRVAAAAAGRS